jgi:signal transduction histidine kinase
VTNAADHKADKADRAALRQSGHPPELSVEHCLQAFDWSKTPLGPRAKWPPYIATLVDVILKSPAPVATLWGPRGIMIYNDAFAALDFARHPQALGTSVFDGWPEAAEFNQHALQTCLVGGTLTLRDFEVAVQRRESGARWFDLFVSPIPDPAERAVGALVFAVETTERVLAERQREDAESQLRDSNETLKSRIAERTNELREVQQQLSQARRSEMVGELSGRAAHDFNNLLQAIYACLYLLERKSDGLSVQPILDAGFQAVEHAQQLSRQLLNLARRTNSGPQLFNVCGRMSSMSGTMQRALRENIDIATDFRPDTWPVEVDPDRFELALLNLMVNARDAMPQGGGVMLGAANCVMDDASPDRVRSAVVGGDSSGERGEYVRIWVRDTGVGMTPAAARVALDAVPAAQPGAQNARRGLIQVVEFCRHAGGYVELETEPGQGTTVSLYLPRAARGAHDATVMANVTKGSRILLVEDDVLLSEAVMAALIDTGYQVCHAATGDQALALLRAGDEVDILLTDVVLPGIASGRRVVEEALSLRPGLPIVVTTGYGARPFNGVSVLAKPYRIEALVSAIEAELAKAS